MVNIFEKFLQNHHLMQHPLVTSAMQVRNPSPPHVSLLQWPQYLILIPPPLEYTRGVWASAEHPLQTRSSWLESARILFSSSWESTLTRFCVPFVLVSPKALIVGHCRWLIARDRKFLSISFWNNRKYSKLGFFAEYTDSITEYHS